MKNSVYFSIDIETDGGSPGLSSMINLGCAAFVPGNPEPIATFRRNYLPLAGAEPDLDTMVWWQKFPDMWKRLQENRVEPAVATEEFAEWVREVAGDKTPVAVAWPASWDWAFIYYYFKRFDVPSPFGHSALDAKSLWFAYTLRKDGRSWASGRTYKSDVPMEWKGGAKHTHDGLDDAIEQGRIFIHLLEELK